MSKNRFKAYLCLIGASAIWGAAGPVIKFTLQGIDPLPFISYRFFIAAILSLVFFLLKIRAGKKFKRLRAHIPLAITYGFLAVPISLGLLFLGLDKTGVLDLALIGAIAPLMVMAGGSLIYHDHITHREKIGIGIVLLGVIVNSFLPILKNGSEIVLTGNILLMLYLVADSGSILMAKKAVRHKIKSSNLTNLAFIIGALTMVPLTIYLYGFENLINNILNLPLKYHFGVWYMAFISGNLAYYLFVRGQKSIEVSEAVLFGYLQPLFMVPLGLFWLHESLSKTFLVGAFIIALGVIIAEYKKPKKKAFT